MFKINSEKALPSKNKVSYNGIAYDGCHFYLTVACQCKIVKFDACFCLEECFNTSRCYTYLCYDSTECCFWATTNDQTLVIYKLNTCFEEIERIMLHCPKGCDGVVTGISYNCCKDMPIISFTSSILQLDKKSPRDSILFKKNSSKWIMGVLSICPYTFCRSIDGREQIIQVYDECQRLIGESKIPTEITVIAAVFVPCLEKRCPCHFCVLAVKRGGYPFILDCVMKCNTPQCACICDCNYKICKNCCCTKPVCCCKDSCCEILDSIALVETAIAHILNAEGEKLQKVVASTDDICKILAVNDSVRKTIEKSTFLEQVLYDKLNAVKELCGSCDEACQ